MESRKGILISFHGGEGSGKSTQHQMAMGALAKEGFIVEAPREPGATEAGEAIRNILLHTIHPLTPVAETLLFLAARAQLVEQKIKPYLEEERIVLLDRFYDETVAYQGYARGVDIEGFIKPMNILTTQGIRPDRSYLIDVSPEIGLARATRDDQDRIEAESLEFHFRVNQGFRDIAAAEPDRYRVFNSETLGIEEIHELIMTDMMKLIEGK